jgi:hypothetical protein
MDDYRVLVTEKEKLECLNKNSLSSINLLIINLESNLGLHSEGPATNVLSQDMDLIVEHFLGVTKETFINNKMGNLRVT